MSDGEWHDVVLRRFGSHVILSIDGGEGELTAEKRFETGEFQEIVVACDRIYLGAKINTFYSNRKIVLNDYSNGEMERKKNKTMMMKEKKKKKQKQKQKQKKKKKKTEKKRGSRRKGAEERKKKKPEGRRKGEEEAAAEQEHEEEEEGEEIRVLRLMALKTIAGRAAAKAGDVEQARSAGRAKSLPLRGIPQGRPGDVGARRFGQLSCARTARNPSSLPQGGIRGWLGRRPQSACSSR